VGAAVICLDCAVLDRREVPAVGVCEQCGAATCLAHAWISRRAGHPAGMAGLAVPVTRRLLCGFCAGRRTGACPAAGPGVAAVQPSR